MKDKSCSALFNANGIGGGDIPPSVRVKSDILPEVRLSFFAENSHTGVSTKNAQDGTISYSYSKKESSKIITYAALVCNAYNLWS